MSLSLPLASNLALLFSYVMSGYGCYLLVLYVPGRVIFRGKKPVDGTTASGFNWPRLWPVPYMRSQPAV